MSQEEIRERSSAFGRRARQVLAESGLVAAWERAGCRVNVVGSLRMGLMASHRDVDLHVYSRKVTEACSFAVMAEIAKDPRVREIKCINGLHTGERCVAWHIFYDFEGEVWQFDVIHIEEGSEYDGYFECMADRIAEVATAEQRDAILRLKFATPEGCDFHGVEYYEAVIADGVRTMEELERWVAAHRAKPPYYWIP